MQEANNLEDLVIALLMAATRRRSDDDDEPAIHALTQAGEAPPPATKAACSIFDLAQRIGAAQPADTQQDSRPSSATPGRAVSIVVRAGDVVRVSGLAYPSNRWTAERAERERIRRAKQLPPKPSAAARVFQIGRGVDERPPAARR